MAGWAPELERENKSLIFYVNNMSYSSKRRRQSPYPFSAAIVTAVLRVCSLSGGIIGEPTFSLKTGSGGYEGDIQC